MPSEMEREKEDFLGGSTRVLDASSIPLQEFFKPVDARASSSPRGKWAVHNFPLRN